MTLLRPPAPAPPGEHDAPRPPEVLFREARRRRRRRWAVGAAVVVVAASAVGFGFGFAGNGGRQPGRLAPSSPKGPKPSGLDKSTPRAGAIAPVSSARLLTVNFFNSTDGYGLFRTGCRVAVANTSDGGAQFSPLVTVDACASGAPGTTPAGALAFDNHGDGFAYGPRLFVTHDGGTSWAPDPQPGDVLSVEALGDSIWMLEADCPALHTFTQTLSTGSTVSCHFELFESTDGGRTWSPSAEQPTPGSLILQRTSDPGALVRVNATSAYVVASPTSPDHTATASTTGSVPLWYTSDGGRSWVEDEVPCGVEHGEAPLGAAVSVAPDGTVFAMCAWGTQVGGSQDKAVFVSTDGGSSWAARGCARLIDSQCAPSGLEGGYLGTLDAVSSTTAFELGERGPVRETTDGGSTWTAARRTATGSAPYSTGPMALIFFDATHGVVLAGTRIWHTDGATSWKTVEPIVVSPPAPPCTASQLLVGRGTGATSSNGHVLKVELLTNRGPECTLSGFPLLLGASANGGPVRIPADGGAWFGTLVPAVLAHGTQGQLWLQQTTTTCAGTTRVHNLRLDLPGGGGTLSLGALSLALACGITATQLGIPPKPSAPPGSAASLKVTLQPRLAAGLSAVVGGSTLHYTVTFTNLTTATVRFVPCPRYTVVIRGATGTSKSERLLARHTSSFACRSLGNIKPRSSAHVRLSVRVPRVKLTTAALIWKLDLPGVTTPPKSTSTTGIGESGMKIFTAKMAAQNGVK